MVQLMQPQKVEKECNPDKATTQRGGTLSEIGGCDRNPACDCKLGQHCRPSKKQHDCGNEKRDSEQQRRAHRSGFEFLMQYQSDYEVAKQTGEEPAAKHQGSPAILRDRKQSNENSKSVAGQTRDQLCSRKSDASEKRI